MATHSQSIPECVKERERTIMENALRMKEIFGEKGLDNFSELPRSIIYANGKEGAKKQGNGGIHHKKRAQRRR